ncbi:hypothetical protein BOTNAR_0268g00080 [Botryotinia narcissicola]|uniref:Uncharacterized protein n=1 Tax=Botryotinia narcissicola TaxID=278944 RepID=A0A4Z1I6F3_9HELO|nr:hypothetical protein BOTNAR_0268g00080 [Botryotinia narcissicola]
MFALCAKPEPNISDPFPRQYCTEPIAFAGITKASPWQTNKPDRQGKTKQRQRQTCLHLSPASGPSMATMKRNYPNADSNFLSHYFTPEVRFPGIILGGVF